MPPTTVPTGPNAEPANEPNLAPPIIVPIKGACSAILAGS